ncbi:MAG: ribonuclease PH [Actinomycetota bacterium]|nr:ribonuclease PH [Actinomycetota bacterium]
MRVDGRKHNELRPFEFERDFTEMANGSCLVTFGKTRVLCTASVDEEVPRWLRDTGKGWVTAEYSMLPGSSPERVRRKNSGRSQEIQRLIGRSLRAAVDLSAIPELQVTVDCDVIQADGGTRTASICGGFVALHDAFTRMILKGQMENHPMSEELAAVSVGVIRGEVCLDLPYVEDSTAEVDLNVVMTGSGKFVEVQGTAEDGPFDRNSLEEMLDVAESGIKEITEAQRDLLSSPPGERAS